MNNRWSLEGRRAIVTGATKGIGKAIAEEFLTLGASVLFVARDEDEVENLADQWSSQGFEAYGFCADVTVQDDRKAIIEEAVAEMHGFDILINNAGTNIRKKTMDYKSDEIHHLLELNLISSFEMCRLAFKHLKESDYPSIVNISSIAASNVVKTGSPYAMSKAGLSHLSRYLAVEWGEFGIRVNCIEPWYIRTPLTEGLLTNDTIVESIKNKTPLPRYGEPEEIAGLAAYLCMTSSYYISGQVIAVDGAASVNMY